MKQTKSLEQLGGLWLEDAPPPLEEQTSRLTRTRWRNRVWLIVELVIVLVGCTVGLVLLSQNELKIGAATMTFSLIGLLVTLATRARYARILTQPVADALQSNLIEAEARYRIAIGGVCVCVGALVFAVVIVLDMDPKPEWLLSGTLLVVTCTPLVWSLNSVRFWRRKYLLLQTSGGDPG